MGYGIFPNVAGSNYAERDRCGHGEGMPWCPEVDFIESNGDCGGATTLRTYPAYNPDHLGASRTEYHYFDQHSIGSAAFHMRIDFDSSGEFIVRRWHNGSHGEYDEIDVNAFHPKPNAGDYSILKAAHETTGMAIISSQFRGSWPDSELDYVMNCGSWPADTENSTFSVRNLRIAGTVVHGPAPRQCSFLV